MVNPIYNKLTSNLVNVFEKYKVSGILRKDYFILITIESSFGMRRDIVKKSVNHRVTLSYTESHGVD